MSAVAMHLAAAPSASAAAAVAKTARAVVDAISPRLRVEPRLVVLEVDGETIVSTSCALWLESDGSDPALFVPKEDVRPGALRPMDRGRFCPRAGLLRYWSLRLNGLTIDRAAKGCERPRPAVERLKGFVSFDPTQLDRIRKVRSWLN